MHSCTFCHLRSFLKYLNSCPDWRRGEILLFKISWREYVIWRRFRKLFSSRICWISCTLSKVSSQFKESSRERSSWYFEHKPVFLRVRLMLFTFLTNILAYTLASWALMPLSNCLLLRCLFNPGRTPERDRSYIRNCNLRATEWFPCLHSPGPPRRLSGNSGRCRSHRSRPGWQWHCCQLPG